MGSKKKETKEKPLDKMTTLELRDVAKGIEGMAGVHGMNKGELVSAIKEAKGIVDEGGKKKDPQLVRNLKKRVHEFKSKRVEALESEDQRMAFIYRRRISRLKKKIRRAL